MRNGKKRRAYSYLRFSSPSQASGDSFRRQNSLAANYAKTHNLELDDSLTFHDLGVSAYRGVNSETGQLNALLEAVRTQLIPKGSVVLVESLDRISRQAVRKALRIFESIVETGVSIVTINDGREYTIESLDNDPFSLLMAILTFIRGNEESAIKSQRVAASWAVRRAQALEKPLTSRCPGWMKLASDRKSFVVIKQHVKTVRRIFKDFLLGKSLLQIVRQLNIERIPVPHGGGRQAAFWQPSGVLYLINNKAVIGTLTTRKYVQVDGKPIRYEKEEIKGYYPAIISVDDFERVQSMRRCSANPLRRDQATFPTKNIIGGLGTCGNCGGPMMLTARSEKCKYLVCRRVEYRAGCVYQSVRYREVEDTLVSRLTAIRFIRNFKNVHFGERHFTMLMEVLKADRLDHPTANRLLKSLVKRVIIYPDRGNMDILWKSGDISSFTLAFTPTTERWSRFKETTMPSPNSGTRSKSRLHPNH